MHLIQVNQHDNSVPFVYDHAWIFERWESASNKKRHSIKFWLLLMNDVNTDALNASQLSHDISFEDEGVNHDPRDINPSTT